MHGADVRKKIEDTAAKFGFDIDLDKKVANMAVSEKQTLEILKVLCYGAKIIILDEPTAALDALAEEKLYEDFNRLIDNRTAVYISHRLSSTRFCDHVAMFVDGELKEYGTHDSLINAGGAYSEMFNVQAAYYVEGEEGEEDAEL